MDNDTQKDQDSNHHFSVAPIQDKPPWVQQHKNHLMAFAGLVLLLLGVIFLLPKAIDPVEQEAVAGTVQPAQPVGKIESPWKDAQLAKERRAAQEILSVMLQRQQTLEDKQVTRWAANEYQQALDTATAADTYYRQREFTQAQNQYRQALTQFDSLIAKSEQVFSDNLQQGSNAIVDGDARQAIAAFELALAINPKDSAAQASLARAQVLEQLLGLLKAGELLEKTGHLEQAQEQYQQALALDRASTPAQTMVARIKQRILDRDFTLAMSKAYSALNQQQYDSALKAFKQAKALKPSATETDAGISQTLNQKTQSQIQQQLAQAQQQEAQEQWQQAAEHYQQALALDTSVVGARIGQIRTQARANLDKKIVDTLAQPYRLATESVYRQTQMLHRDAKALKNPGPRLQQQIQQLDKLLQTAVTPVAIQLQSDNETDVTLYKIGHLGNFRSRSMELKPGRYTAVGTRNGYRDVRQEFTVSADPKTPTIVIQCEEKVAMGG